MRVNPDKENGEWQGMGGLIRLVPVLICLFCCFAMDSAAAQGGAPQSLGMGTALSVQADGLADQIVVYKSKRMLYLLKHGHILRKYRVALGRNPVGHKLEAGDRRTPEGKYTIDWKNPDSKYYRSLRISYPDATDAGVAAALETKPGELIMIHGMPNGRTAAQVGHPLRDWTDGCIAVTNTEMAEIWDRVAVGTPISIWP